jgi:hypothetical protein
LDFGGRRAGAGLQERRVGSFNQSVKTDYGYSNWF